MINKFIENAILREGLEKRLYSEHVAKIKLNKPTKASIIDKISADFPLGEISRYSTVINVCAEKKALK